MFVPELRVLFFGAGQANLGAAELLVSALADQGVSPETARNNVWLFDSKGLVVTGRPEGAISDDKAAFAHSGRAVTCPCICSFICPTKEGFI